jgi:hypothetical protein
MSQPSAVFYNFTIQTSTFNVKLYAIDKVLNSHNQLDIDPKLPNIIIYIDS